MENSSIIILKCQNKSQQIENRTIIILSKTFHQYKNQKNSPIHKEITYSKRILNKQKTKIQEKQLQMQKSINSKISGYSSILNSISPEESLEMLRISLKKEKDRKEKLEKLMEKYDKITVQQKTHIKAIKSSIIELKDLESNFKTKFFLNPIIYVDNKLSQQTREYLCVLLNTFYSKYDQNSQCEFKTKAIGKQMRELLHSISSNQQNLLKISKETIGVQVHLQAELLGFKNRLKDENQKQKELEEENKQVGTICRQFQEKYKLQLTKVESLRTTCQQLEDNIRQLKEKVAQGEMVKKGKEEMMANQISYQEKFQMQLFNVDQDIQRENQKEKLLKNKIKQKKIKVEQLRAKLNKLNMTVGNFEQKNNVQNCEKNNHNTVYPLNSTSRTNSTQPLRSHLSLSKIKKYSEVMDSINTTLEMSRSTLNFGCGVKSNDAFSHEVGMKIISIKNENLPLSKQSRILLR